jgi:hypothetical protein
MLAMEGEADGATAPAATRRRDEATRQVIADHIRIDTGRLRQSGNRDRGKCWHGPRRCLDDTNISRTGRPVVPIRTGNTILVKGTCKFEKR